MTEDELERYLCYLEENPQILEAIRKEAWEANLEVQPRTFNEVGLHVQSYYGGHRLAANAVCPGHTAPLDVWASIFLGRERGEAGYDEEPTGPPVHDAVIIASRESGKTSGYAFLEHMLMRFHGIEIANVGAIQAQADKLYRYFVQHCYRDHFQHLLAKLPMMKMTEFKNGARLEVLPGTIRAVNSPHPNLACIDETELFDQKVLDEAISMPIRHGDRPPTILFTSSRKKAYGPLEKLLRQAVEMRLKTFIFCVFEVMQRCPPERHQNGVGCRGVVDDQGEFVQPPCPLAPDCLYTELDERGDEVYVDGPGRAVGSDGFMEIDDVIRQRGITAPVVWESQWLSKKPMTEGLVYKEFDPLRHLVEYTPNLMLPVHCFVDFGFTNPNAILFGQMLPTEELVIFAEMYASGIVPEIWAERVVDTPWFENLLTGSSVCVGDPARPDAIATFNRYGIPLVMARNDVLPGIARVRYLFSPPGRKTPMLFFDYRCTNTIDEASQYHYPARKDGVNTKEEPEKSNDHAMDALRYGVADLYKDIIVGDA